MTAAILPSFFQTNATASQTSIGSAPRSRARSVSGPIRSGSTRKKSARCRATRVSRDRSSARDVAATAASSMAVTATGRTNLMEYPFLSAVIEFRRRRPI